MNNTAAAYMTLPIDHIAVPCRRCVVGRLPNDSSYNKCVSFATFAKYERPGSQDIDIIQPTFRSKPKTNLASCETLVAGNEVRH